MRVCGVLLSNAHNDDAPAGYCGALQNRRQPHPRHHLIALRPVSILDAPAQRTSHTCTLYHILNVLNKVKIKF